MQGLLPFLFKQVLAQTNDNNTMMLYKKSKTFAKTTLILREKPRTRSVLSTLAKDNFAKGKVAIGAAHLA